MQNKFSLLFEIVSTLPNADLIRGGASKGHFQCFRSSFECLDDEISGGNRKILHDYIIDKMASARYPLQLF